VIVILVRWQIKKGRREEFVRSWERILTPRDLSGLHREILTGPDPSVAPRHRTLKVGAIDDAHETFVNVGIWKSVAAFERAVGAFIRRHKAGFEARLRERVVLVPLSDRRGHYRLPRPRLAAGRVTR
jgi:hypothetical protein